MGLTRRVGQYKWRTLKREARAAHATDTPRAINSAGECYLHTVEVTGSNPVSPTDKMPTRATFWWAFLLLAMLLPGVELDEPDFDEGLPPDGPPWRLSLPGG